MGTMAITAISVRFPTINGRVTRARGQVGGQDTKAVIRRRRSGCVTVVVQPISSLVHFVRSAEKVGGIGKKEEREKRKRSRARLDQGSATKAESKCCRNKLLHGSREHGGEGAAVRRRRQHRELEAGGFRMAEEVEVGGNEEGVDMRSKEVPRCTPKKIYKKER